MNTRMNCYFENKAIIEHSYYHLGQITLIKKLLLQKGEIS